VYGENWWQLGCVPKLSVEEHTVDVDPLAVVIELVHTKCDSDPPPALHVVCATRFGYQLVAAVVDVHPTVPTLHALSHEPIEKAATVVTPGRVVVVRGLELVWDRLNALWETCSRADEGHILQTPLMGHKVAHWMGGITIILSYHNSSCNESHTTR